MTIGFDIDGTLDAFPTIIQHMMSAFKAAGDRIVILTGTDGTRVNQDQIDAKRTYLANMGVSSDLYDALIVCPDPHDVNKAKAVQSENILVIFDNDKANIKAAAKAGCCSFLLWNTKVG